MITVNGLTVIKGKSIILKDIEFEVRSGETVCLLGRNGAGKTTLLRAMLGAEPLQAGQSLVRGLDMHQPERQQVLSDIGAAIYPNSFYNYLSAAENLLITQRYYGSTRFSLNEILERFELIEVSKRPASRLSAGMQQRLLLALSFINRPDLLLLDEPFNTVDRDNTKIILRQLSDLQREFNTTILLTSHSLPDVEVLYNRVLLLKAGRLVADTTKTDMLNIQTSLTELYDQLA